MSGPRVLSTEAPGKINVCLFVGGTQGRADGRHELVSVMQAVDLCDEVSVRGGVAADALHCEGVSGPNIVSAALDAFRARTGAAGPVAITVAKRIPVSAGMAGGSADAGAVLRLLNELHGGPLDDDALGALAAGLGADVPAQVRPGRMLATGAGEHVEVRVRKRSYGVVVLPHPEPLSTPAVYREFDRLGLARGSAELAALEGQVREHADDLPDALVVNDLQPAAISLCPPVGANLERLRAAGADLVLVSGSGPTTLGLTRDADAAERVAIAVGPDAIAVRPWPLGP
ncbi:MAG: 4-(cytidine 5-diphospho)-2-C-methyl-D-erythritol kinase [Solirubrobacterales bacterium]|nr:4-(cytidine 5-diphospho)-2-C-methyl-D-erythritol kinase [Solirubrobacterales bacterium]